MDIRKLQRTIIDALEDVKAQDIVVFNTEHLSPMFERVIIASANNSRQTKALAVSVREAVKEAGEPVPRSEGEENGEWIIVDCGAAVVHVMQPMIRTYYRLEEIWGEKPVRVKLLSDAKPKTRLTDSSTEKKTTSAKKAVARKTPAKKAAAKKAVVPRKSSATSKTAKSVRKTVTKTAAKKAPVARKRQVI